MAAAAERRARLVEAANALSSELSLAAVLQGLVAAAVETTGAEYGALGVLGDDGGIDDFITVGLSEQQRMAIGDIPRGRGILGLLIAEPHVIRLDDLSAHPASAGFPPNHPPMRTFLGAPVRARGRVFGNLYLTEKRGGGGFTEEDEADLLFLAAHAGTAISNARLYEESQRRGAWLDSLREIAGEILRDADPADTLRLLVTRARHLVDGDSAALSVPTADGQSLVVAAADGTGAEELDGMRLPLQGSISGEVFSRGVAAVFVDASTSGGFRPLVDKGRMGPTAFVPLRAREMTAGTLVVGRHPGRPRMTADDVALLESFADQAALVLAQDRARRERERLALVEDRERIAKDMHDGVIQSLFAVGMGLQGTAAIVSDERVAGRLTDAVGEIDHAISDLRSYIFGLRPAVLGAGLLDGVDRLAHDFEARTGVTTVAELDGIAAAALEPVADQVTQIVREALSNVGKHAGAQTCRVALRREADEIVVEVDDDGRGFDVGSAAPGMGLANLRQRALALGAVLEVRSSATEGTTLQLRIPDGSLG